jgi:hypothetical protein
MYAYYAARSAQIRVPHAVAILVTLLQTSQMGKYGLGARNDATCASRFQHFAKAHTAGFGLYICYTASKVKQAGVPCQMSAFNMTFCLGIYASYFILFCKFFYDAYLSPKRLSSRKVE